MSEEGYRKRRRLQKKVVGFILMALLFFVIAAVVLGIINIIGIFFGGFPTVDRILGGMAYVADAVAYGISYFLSYPYVLPIIGTLIFAVFIFKVFIRGYWVLLMRPWVLLTSTATLAAVLWVWFTFYPGFMTYFSFIITGPFSMAFMLLRFFVSAVPEVSAEISAIQEVLRSLYSAISAYVCPVTTWIAGLYIMSRMTVLFNSFFGYDEIIGSTPALEIAYDVVKEARRVTHRIPKHIIFYREKGEGINACAFDHNKVAMTAELMECDEEIIRAVIGHELGHIANKDVSANLISGSNVKLVCGLFTIPYFLLWGQSDSSNKVEVGPIVFVLIFLALFGAVLNFFINTAHYVCYIFGGKRCEYKADRFSSRLGYGAGLLNFMLFFYDAPSGGLKDPHPSMRNRVIHISEYIIRHPKKYPELIVEEARKINADPDGYYRDVFSPMLES